MTLKDFCKIMNIDLADEQQRNRLYKYGMVGMMKFKIGDCEFIAREASHDQSQHLDRDNKNNDLVVGIHMMTIDRETLKCTRPKNCPTREQSIELLEKFLNDKKSMFYNYIQKNKITIDDCKMYQTTDDCECCS